MRVSELEVGPITDALTALAQEYKLEDVDGYVRVQQLASTWIDKPHPAWEACWTKYSPSQGNQQTYEVAQKFKLRVDFKHHTAAYCRWDELTPDYWTEYGGKTTALAICKAVIASKFGEEIDESILRKIS